MESTTSRRRVVQVAGAGATMALLAGCADDGEGDDPGDFEEETGNGQDIEEEDDGEEAEDGGETNGAVVR